MATFILRWNPEISNVKIDEWEEWVKHGHFVRVSWSVWDTDTIEAFDDFYMIKVGSGNTGVVMKGIFISNPKEGDDWANKGRKRYYRDLHIQYIFHPDKDTIITTDQLKTAVPDFDWEKGHSGEILSKNQVDKMSELWDKYVEKNRGLIDYWNRHYTYGIEPSTVKRIKGFELYKQLFSWVENIDEEVYCRKLAHDSANLSFSMDYHEGVFRISLYIGDGVLYIKCRSLHRLNTNLESGWVFMHVFEINEMPGNALRLYCNGVEVICDEIEFERIEEYPYDSIPANIR